MDCGFKDEITTLPSAFGDTGVRVSRLFPDKPDGTHALLLHGVHSSANLGHRNKFRHLAEILAARGVTPWLCETGRVSVSREECDEPLAWIEESFGGKTFGEEHDDCLAALNLVLAQKPAKLWISRCCSPACPTCMPTASYSPAPASPRRPRPKA